MRKAVSLTAILFLAFVFSLPTDPTASGRGDWAASKPDIRQADPNRGGFVAGQLIVKFKGAAAPSVVSGLMASYGFAEADLPDKVGARLMAVPAGRETEIIAELSADDRVEYAEPNYLLYPVFLPDDTYFVAGNEWNLQKIGMPSAWDISQGNPAVKVAVIDTGIDTGHPDKPVNLQIGFNYVTNSFDVSDSVGHGTFVSGIIAAATNNRVGIAGMAPGVTIRAYKEINPITSSFDTFRLSRAIRDAADEGARVINLSLGGPDFSETLRSATDYAWGKGALVIAASGNCGGSSPGGECVFTNQVEYPAANPNVMSVGATNAGDGVAYFSTQNSTVIISAPGQSILSTSPTLQGSYKTGSGTSFSAPHVVALAALVWSVNPGLTNKQVGDIITSTARDLGAPGRDNGYGWGRIDAAAALAAARSPLTPTPVGAATPTFTPSPTPTPPTTVSPTPTPPATASPPPTPAPPATASPTPTSTPTPGGTPTPTLSPTPTPLTTQLLAGWNLISVPGQLQDPSIRAVFAEAKAIDRVFTSTNGVWSYAFRAGDVWNGNLTQIADGRGYWVYASAPGAFSVSVRPPDSSASKPAYSLPAGWNLIGVTSLPPTLPVDTYLASLQGKWTTLYNYDPGLGYSLAAPGAGFPDVHRFRGYWIFLNSPGTLLTN